MARWQRERRPVVGTLAGMAGGLFASWVMNQFQTFWSKAQEKAKKRHPEQQQQPQSSAESEPATVKAADKAAHAVLGRELEPAEKKTAGPLVHYIFGASMGAAYGLISEYLPQARFGFGVLFGTALFALADEVAVPALGLSKSPTEYPLSTHAYALASHVVYGLSTEAVRKTVRAAA